MRNTIAENQGRAWEVPKKRHREWVLWELREQSGDTGLHLMKTSSGEMGTSSHFLTVTGRVPAFLCGEQPVCGVVCGAEGDERQGGVVSARTGREGPTSQPQAGGTAHLPGHCLPMAPGQEAAPGQAWLVLRDQH